LTARGPLPDELALAGPEHLDPGDVARYDAKAGFDPTADLELLGRHGLDGDDTVIDLGAGTGTFALAVAGVCERVIAVDVSRAMLATIRERVTGTGVTNVECVHAGFLSYDHPGAPADVVYTRNALHHLPDFWKAVALDRIAGMLRPGGILCLRDLVFAWAPSEVEQRVARWLDQAAETPAEGWTRAELERHLQTEFSTYTWMLEPMIERAGFEIVATDHTADGVHAAYVCTARSI
jgi:ubiquinone/menaquinone biosynthesis C-methylase UbiE